MTNRLLSTRTRTLLRASMAALLLGLLSATSLVPVAQAQPYPPLPHYLPRETPSHYIARLEWEAYYAHPNQPRYHWVTQDGSRYVTLNDLAGGAVNDFQTFTWACQEDAATLAQDIAFAHQYGALNNTDISYVLLVSMLSLTAPLATKDQGYAANCVGGITYIVDYLVGGGDPSTFGKFNQ